MKKSPQEEVIDTLMNMIIENQRLSMPTMIIIQTGPLIKIDSKDIKKLEFKVVIE